MLRASLNNVIVALIKVVVELAGNRYRVIRAVLCRVLGSNSSFYCELEKHRMKNRWAHLGAAHTPCIMQEKQNA